MRQHYRNPAAWRIAAALCLLVGLLFIAAAIGAFIDGNHRAPTTLVLGLLLLLSGWRAWKRSRA